MSQVSVKWVYETFDEKPPAIPANGSHVVSAPLDHDILPHAVVPLSALREVVEALEDMISLAGGLNEDDAWFGERRDANIRIEKAERLLVSLGDIGK